MKKIILPVIFLFYVSNCFAQDTVVKKDWMTQSVMEIYHVLKPGKKIKQGLYQALFNGTVPLASGRYLADKKIGIWHFYDTRGQIIENFNYDNQTLLYEEPADSITARQIVYAFDDSLKRTDMVTKPIKPGGRYFGYINFLKIYKLPFDMFDIQPSRYVGILELLVSPGGRLADVKVHIKYDGEDQQTVTFSPEIFSDEDRIFIPATKNNEPIMSRIFVRCRITEYGDMDID